MKVFLKANKKSKYQSQILDKIRILQLKRITLGLILLTISIVILSLFLYYSNQKNRSSDVNINKKDSNIISIEPNSKESKLETDAISIDSLSFNTSFNASNVKLTQDFTPIIKYHVITKSFKEASKADGFLKDLKNRGFSQAEIIITPPFYWVSAENYKNKKAAINRKNKLKYQYEGAWVEKRKD